MPVKYSVVKDLDCVSNQLSGQAQQTADSLPHPRAIPNQSPALGIFVLECDRIRSRFAGYEASLSNPIFVCNRGQKWGRFGEPAPFKSNRGQLDAETGRPAPGRLRKTRCSPSGDPKRTHQTGRSRPGGLWSRTAIHYSLALYSRRGCFRRLYPRSLLERR
jgi:hypothetical protein